MIRGTLRRVETRWRRIASLVALCLVAVACTTGNPDAPGAADPSADASQSAGPVTDGSDDPLATTGALDVVPRIDQPNIVMVMTDDQTYESLRVMDWTKSWFGTHGTTFDEAVVGYALCCPSRATHLTGQNAINHGVESNQAPSGGYQRLDHTNTLPVWLQEAGYWTSHVGKYLNGYGYPDRTEVPPGWDDWFGLITFSYRTPTVNENGEVRDYTEQDGIYQTDLLRDRAIQAIDAGVAAGQPFFVDVHTYAPHVDPIPADRHRGRFADEPLPTPPSFDEEDIEDKPAYIRSRPRISDSVRQQITERYRAELETLLAVDELIEGLVGRLDELGVLDETVLMFTSDNGYMAGQHRFPSGKTLPFEESVHVPLLVAGPGFPRQHVVGTAVGNVDVPTTIADLAGATPRLEVDGISLLDTLADPETAATRRVFLERLASGEVCHVGLRDHRYTYVDQWLSGEEQLYDRQEDPFELESRHADPAYADVLDELRSDLQAQLGDRDLPECVIPMEVAVASVEVTESRAGSVLVRVPIVRNWAGVSASEDLTMHVQVGAAGGTATAGQDFVDWTGEVIMPRRQVLAFAEVEILPDALAEGVETIEVRILDADAQLVLSQPVGEIRIMDTPAQTGDGDPVVSIGTLTLPEFDGDGRLREVVGVPVTLSDDSPGPVDVSWSLSADGTTPQRDFELDDGSIRFRADEFSAEIPVEVYGDLEEEPEERVAIRGTAVRTGGQGETPLGEVTGMLVFVDNDVAD